MHFVESFEHIESPTNNESLRYNENTVGNSDRPSSPKWRALMPSRTIRAPFMEEWLCNVQ